MVQAFLDQKELHLHHVLLFIEPIVTVARSAFNQAKQNALSLKANQVLHQISKVKDFCDKNSTQVPLENFSSLLANLLSNFSKTSQNELQKSLRSLCIWTVCIFKNRILGCMQTYAGASIIRIINMV